MATEFLDPTSNINSVWEENSFTNIDSGTRQPSDPPEGDPILASEGDDTEEQIYGMEDLSSLTSITEIKIWAFGALANFSEGSMDCGCRVKVGGNLETEQSLNLPVGFDDFESEWRSVTFSGSWNQSDVNALEMSFIANNMGEKDEIIIFSAYAEITGTVSTGFTRKVKISGTFQDKPIKTKVSGTFEDKPIQIKVGGTFQDA